MTRTFLQPDDLHDLVSVSLERLGEERPHTFFVVGDEDPSGALLFHDRCPRSRSVKSAPPDG